MEIIILKLFGFEQVYAFVDWEQNTVTIQREWNEVWYDLTFKDSGKITLKSPRGQDKLERYRVFELSGMKKSGH